MSFFEWRRQITRRAYSSINYYPDTLLISPDKLGCGIPAADGLDNSFRIHAKELGASALIFARGLVIGYASLLQTVANMCMREAYDVNTVENEYIFTVTGCHST